MSKDLNLCQFIGRLGRDIELKYTANGQAVANFSIACGDDYKDKNGAKVEQTNWVNIVMFGKVAELAAQYMSKGSKCYVSGKQVTRKWQDKNGQDRYSTEVIANEMQFLDSKGDSGQQQRPQQSYAGDPPTKEPTDDFLDDIPF